MRAFAIIFLLLLTAFAPGPGGREQSSTKARKHKKTPHIVTRHEMGVVPQSNVMTITPPIATPTVDARLVAEEAESLVASGSTI